MDTAIFIPARLNSKRLPKKMLCKIGEQPLIAHTIDRAKESDIKNIFLATDSKEIIAAIKNKNVQSILTDTSHQSGSDRIYEALNKIDDAKQFKYIINLQGDLPLINSDIINHLKHKIKQSSSDIVTLVAPIVDTKKINDPNIVKVAINFYDQSCKSGRAVYFSRQSIPTSAAIYYEHIGIYAYKRQALKKFVTAQQTQLEKQESLEQLRAYSLDLNIEVHLLDIPPASIDTAEDLETIRAIYAQQFPYYQKTQHEHSHL